MAAGQLTKHHHKWLEVHSVIQVRSGKMQCSHLFTFLSVECTEERDGLTAENGTFTGERKLQCITADLECVMLTVLTHSAPSMPARLTKLGSSKLSQVF